MSGSLSARESIASNLPSQGNWVVAGGEYTPAFANAYLLPPHLYQSAEESLYDSIKEAEELREPVPSSEAVQRAKNAIQTLSLYLMRSYTGSQPIIAVAVTSSGDIEVVGYFHRVIGRWTARIDSDGTCVRWTTTLRQ